MKFHPDRNPGDHTAEEKFKECKEAYEMLSDADKRAAYDRYGHAGVDPNSAAGAGMGGFAEAFSDIFGDIFGGQQRRGGGPQVYRGADLRYPMEVSLEQAANGYETNIKIPTWHACDTCHGSGAKPGTKPQTCPTCAGNGTVRITQGFFSIQQTCGRCHGKGKVIADPCVTCDGAGKVKATEEVHVPIPAGINDGMRVRFANRGEPGVNGGPNGDLYVEIHVKPHAVFQRDGDDLHCEMPISFATATLGGQLEIPQLTGGAAAISIPEGTQSGKTFRVRGKGIKGVRSGYPGDLYCHVAVETPVRLTDPQKKLLKDFDASMREGGAKHSPQTKSWADKVKEFFA
jgi:molecular chaperone DnaJ